MESKDNVEASPSTTSTSSWESSPWSEDSGEQTAAQTSSLKRTHSFVDCSDDDADEPATRRQCRENPSTANIPDDGLIKDPDLRGIRQLIFLDIDNWSTFFQRLPGILPEDTFVWGFYGIQSNWKEPLDCHVYNNAKDRGIVFINPPCSFRKDAADFAICMQVGRMSEKLSIKVAFIILSGDGGFQELYNQLSLRSRVLRVINPHGKSDSIVYTLIQSVVDK